MADVNISLSSSECTILYNAVFFELQTLQDDLKDKSIPKTQHKEIIQSIDICKSILSKINVANPNSTYVYVD